MTAIGSEKIPSNPALGIRRPYEGLTLNMAPAVACLRLHIDSGRRGGEATMWTAS